MVSVANEGLKKAIRQVLAGASWQQCRVHFMRNLLAHISKGDKAVVAVAVRTLIAQRTRPAASEKLAEVMSAITPRWPKAAELLAAVEEEILITYLAFPEDHWRRIYSTNPLARLNQEVKRRTNGVGIFPNRASAIRLVGAQILELDDEWQIGRRYFSQASLKLLYEPENFLVPDRLPLSIAPIHWVLLTNRKRANAFTPLTENLAGRSGRDVQQVTRRPP